MFLINRKTLFLLILNLLPFSIWADINQDLLKAVIGNNLSQVNQLLIQGANVNTTDHEGRTPLHLATKNKNKDIVNLLISKNANIQAKNLNGYSAIHYAAWKGSLEIMEILFTQGADINDKNLSEYTPLHFASRDGHLGIVKFLLEKGAVVDPKTKGNATPLHFASIRAQLEVAMLLLEKGADINSKNNLGWTPLHLSSNALNDKGLDYVKFLVSKGAQVDSVDSFRRTPLFLTSWKGNLEIAKYLVEMKASKELIDQNQDTPLHHSAMLTGSTKIPMVKFFLEIGIDVNLKNSNGIGPLQIAVVRNNSEVVNLFLESYADVNDQASSSGESGLHLATRYGLNGMTNLLIEKGANLNAEDKIGRNPLFGAAWRGDLEMVNFLIEKGANINMITKDANTPLHYAYMSYSEKKKSIIDFLKAKGAAQNVRNTDGKIPAEIIKPISYPWYINPNSE